MTIPVTYLGRDYGSYMRQHDELIERLGFGQGDDRSEAAEDDLRRDLEHERRGGTVDGLLA